MPHPKAAAAPPTTLPPAEASFAPPPSGFDEVPSNPQESSYGDDDQEGYLPPPPASARGKKGKKKAAVEAPLVQEVEAEFAPPPEGEEYEDGEEAYYEQGQAGDEPEAPERLPEPEADDGSVASDEHDSEPPDVQVEVAQLQDMVNKCLKTALKGCPCTILQNGERTSTRYFVDEALENVTIQSWQTTQNIEIVVPISGIQDIFCVPEDGEAAFPAEVVNLLAEEEKDLLLMIVFQGRPGGYGKFCLLMDSREGRDGFMEAMRVLCVASRFNAEQSSSSSHKSGGQVAAGVVGAAAKQAAVAPPAGGKAQDSPALPRQQVSVRFFMRSIGIKALQPPQEQGKTCPLPPLIKDGVTAYISAFGYRPRDDMMWEMPVGDANACTRPTISIRVRQHFEAAKHTWYIVETTLRMDKAGNVPRLDWLAPRRLAHLRMHLHGPIKDILGDAYSRHFAGASFAHRLGLPGTTAQLHRWVNALADVINSRRVPPLVVATALNFLEAPNPAVGAAPTIGSAEDLVPFQAAKR